MAGSVRLREIMDPEAFSLCVRKGLVSERSCPYDGSLKVYCYTRKVQIHGLWTNETMLARGLVLRLDSEYPDNKGLDGSKDLDNNRDLDSNRKLDDSIDYGECLVVARGLRKFFTVDHAGSDWGRMKFFDDDENVVLPEDVSCSGLDLGDVMDLKAHVAEKIDGSLGVLVVHDGRMFFSTKGSFESSQAQAGNILLESLSDRDRAMIFRVSEDHDVTFLFEIVIPGEHPIFYGDESRLVYLGVVSNATGKWFPDRLSQERFNVSFDSVETTSDSGLSSLREALTAPDPGRGEGWVVTVDTGCLQGSSGQGFSDRGASGLAASGQVMFKVKHDSYYEKRTVFREMRSMFPGGACSAGESDSDGAGGFVTTDPGVVFKNLSLDAILDRSVDAYAKVRSVMDCYKDFYASRALTDRLTFLVSHVQDTVRRVESETGEVLSRMGFVVSYDDEAHVLTAVSKVDGQHVSFWFHSDKDCRKRFSLAMAERGADPGFRGLVFSYLDLMLSYGCRDRSGRSDDVAGSCEAARSRAGERFKQSLCSYTSRRMSR